MITVVIILVLMMLMLTIVDDCSGHGDCNNTGVLMVGMVMKMV